MPDYFSNGSDYNEKNRAKQNTLTGYKIIYEESQMIISYKKNVFKTRLDTRQLIIPFFIHFFLKKRNYNFRKKTAYIGICR